MLVPADRLLVPPPAQRAAPPARRSWSTGWATPGSWSGCCCCPGSASTLTFRELGGATRRGWLHGVRAGRRAGAGLDRAGAVPGHGRQVGPDPAVRLAARRHGRTDAGVGADPRGHHGDRRACTWARGCGSCSRCRPAVMAVLAVAGVLTALLGAVLAMVQQDLKKVLAYSTISQLGFMFLALGVGAHGAAVFHLVTHACFKACLFLAAGSVIHAMHGVLDDAVPSESGHDPRLASDPTRRPGHAQHGRPGAGDAAHPAGLRPGRAGAGRLPVRRGLLFQGRDPVAGVRSAAACRVPGWCAVGAGAADRGADLVLRVPQLLPGVSRPPAAGRGRAGPGAARIAGQHAGAAAGAGGGLGGGRGALLGWPEAWGGHPLLETFLAPVDRRSATGPTRAVSPGAWLPLLLQALGVLAALARLGGGPGAVPGSRPQRGAAGGLAQPGGRLARAAVAPAVGRRAVPGAVRAPGAGLLPGGRLGRPAPGRRRGAGAGARGPRAVGPGRPGRSPRDRRPGQRRLGGHAGRRPPPAAGADRADQPLRAGHRRRAPGCWWPLTWVLR